MTMPIEEIDDYPEKMTEFKLHWDSVNTQLGPDPANHFKLAGGYDVDGFSADLDAVVAALTNQEGLDNNLDFARADRDDLRSELRERLILFRSTVKALLPDSRYERALPDTPAERADQQKLLDAWDDIAHIWTQVNADQPAEIGADLTLRGGYALAQFQTDLGTMRTRYDAVKATERAAKDGRGERDVLLEAAYNRMVQYRERLPLTLEPDDPLLASMPTITPTPGSTPDAVTASGQWDETSIQAVLTWTASTNPNLVEYEVRMTPAATFDSNNASTIGNLTPGFEQFETMEGLANPGDVASYKVYVMLSTGNEAGSNTVTITRP